MPAMSDFSCNVKENIKRLETSLNVERNFDILQREVMIAGHRAGFFFIDGFVQEDMIESIAYGQSTPEEAADNAIELINDYLSGLN